MPIYSGNVRVAERLLQRIGGRVDFGLSDGRTSELRAGWEKNDIRWTDRIGVDDCLPNVFDSQNKALFPQSGRRLTLDAGYLYNAAGSVNMRRFEAQFSTAARPAKRSLSSPRMPVPCSVGTSDGPTVSLSADR